ncbi:hypothetical protein Pelo_8883 [Pelomyxa schiedti]|nr:hypothetical protein Pelo_8883 [Pelomyxa schiedti]
MDFLAGDGYNIGQLMWWTHGEALLAAWQLDAEDDSILPKEDIISALQRKFGPQQPYASSRNKFSPGNNSAPIASGSSSVTTTTRDTTTSTNCALLSEVNCTAIPVAGFCQKVPYLNRKLSQNRNRQCHRQLRGSIKTRSLYEITHGERDKWKIKYRKLEVLAVPLVSAGVLIFHDTEGGPLVTNRVRPGPPLQIPSCTLNSTAKAKSGAAAVFKPSRFHQRALSIPAGDKMGNEPLVLSTALTQ